ncbi:MAG TPA: trigger factor, partial [Porphyromonadaceae bacterium]|nr:trigger factor [Porphyromonadaceae bacterium]
MDISVKKSEDNTTAVVKMVVKEEDYYPSVEKSLRSVRQNLEMDGFRKGKVPYEIVRAKYEV